MGAAGGPRLPNDGEPDAIGTDALGHDQREQSRVQHEGWCPEGTVLWARASDGGRTVPVMTPGKVKQTTTGEVEVPTRFLKPIPILRTDSMWFELGWPDEGPVGFAIRRDGGVHLYYNAEMPFYLDTKRDMSRRGLGDVFARNYEMHLITHAAIALNHDLPEEEAVSEEQQKRLRAYYHSVACTLCLAAKAQTFDDAIQAKASDEAA